MFLNNINENGPPWLEMIGKPMRRLCTFGVALGIAAVGVASPSSTLFANIEGDTVQIRIKGDFTTDNPPPGGNFNILEFFAVPGGGIDDGTLPSNPPHNAGEVEVTLTFDLKYEGGNVNNFDFWLTLDNTGGTEGYEFSNLEVHLLDVHWVNDPTVAIGDVELADPSAEIPNPNLRTKGPTGVDPDGLAIADPTLGMDITKDLHAIWYKLNGDPVTVAMGEIVKFHVASNFTHAPEPSTYAMLGTCLALASFAKKRRKQRAIVKK